MTKKITEVIECNHTMQGIQPSEVCKQAGLDSLAELGRISGIQTRTLIKWFHSRKKLFNTIVLGAVVLKKQNGKTVKK